MANLAIIKTPLSLPRTRICTFTSQKIWTWVCYFSKFIIWHKHRTLRFYFYFVKDLFRNIFVYKWIPWRKNSLQYKHSNPCTLTTIAATSCGDNVNDMQAWFFVRAWSCNVLAACINLRCLHQKENLRWVFISYKIYWNSTKMSIICEPWRAQNGN